MAKVKFLRPEKYLDLYKIYTHKKVRIIMRKVLLTILLICCEFTYATENRDFQEIFSELGDKPLYIKIYSETLSLTLPKGFKIGSKSEKNGTFTQVFEKNEDPNQKIFISGIQDASIKESDPLRFAGNLIKRIYGAGCQKHFSTTDIGEMKIKTGQPAFVFIVGCGVAKTPEESEKDKVIVMATAIKGGSDVYVIQWIERSATEKVPPTSWSIWRARLDNLLPLSVN